MKNKLIIITCLEGLLIFILLIVMSRINQEHGLVTLMMSSLIFLGLALLSIYGYSISAFDEDKSLDTLKKVQIGIFWSIVAIIAIILGLVVST